VAALLKHMNLLANLAYTQDDDEEQYAHTASEQQIEDRSLQVPSSLEENDL
jgi:hypothetical protein